MKAFRADPEPRLTLLGGAVQVRCHAHRVPAGGLGARLLAPRERNKTLTAAYSSTCHLDPTDYR
jgi:hypothetical protein